MDKLTIKGKIAGLIIFLFVFACGKEPDPILDNQENSILQDSIFKEYAGTTKGYKDGPVLEAQFENPILVAKGLDKSLYIVESKVDARGPFVYGGFRIRKISPEGIVSTFFGTEGSNQNVTDIRGIAVNKLGVVFISDGNQIKKLSSDGSQAIVVAGDGSTETMKDGAALSASFWQPAGLAFDKNDCLYIMDAANNAIRLLSNGKVSTLAGGNRLFTPDHSDNITGPEDGIGRDAEFDNPQFIVLDASGNVYVSGGYFPIIRKITPQGVVTTHVGGNLQYESDAVDTFRGLTNPFNRRFYANRVYSRSPRLEHSFSVFGVSLSGTEFATLVTDEYQFDSSNPGDDGYPPASEDGLNFPTGMVIVDGILFICNTGEHRIRKIDLN